MVGFRTSDDGGVYRLDERTALIQTVDFFTPIVDDPHDFGAIAAANALSDVYAMGGRPLTALALVCFPYKTLPSKILSDIVAGGAVKIAESGAVVIGGHSVADDEIKFGYAVTGTVEPDRVWRNNRPRAGDALLLTKPLGTGLITTAVKQDKLETRFLLDPVKEMKRLNQAACEAGRKRTVHAATDVTGFGLLGHLFEMLRGSELGAEILTEELAVFDGVWTAIERGALTAARKTNKEYISAYPVPETPAYARFEQVLLDPQTSGGLLLALPREEAETLHAQLSETGHRASLIGTVTARREIRCL